MKYSFTWYVVTLCFDLEVFIFITNSAGGCMRRPGAESLKADVLTPTCQTIDNVTNIMDVQISDGQVKSLIKYF